MEINTGSDTYSVFGSLRRSDNALATAAIGVSFLLSKSIFQLPGLGANRRSVDLVCLHARIITNDALATAAIGVSFQHHIIYL